MENITKFEKKMLEKTRKQIFSCLCVLKKYITKCIYYSKFAKDISKMVRICDFYESYVKICGYNNIHTRGNITVLNNA